MFLALRNYSVPRVRFDYRGEMSALLKEMDVLLNYVWGTLSKIETMKDSKMNLIHLSSLQFKILHFMLKLISLSKY